MNKSKRLQLILIPVVAGIWAVIFYRVLDFSSEEEVADPIPVQHEMGGTDQLTREREKLDTSYPDPFLKRKRYVTREIVKTEQPKEPPVERKVPEVRPLNLMYLGSIANEKTKSRIGIIRFRAEEHFVREGDQVANFEVVGLFEDSLSYAYSGQTFMVMKQEEKTESMSNGSQ